MTTFIRLDNGNYVNADMIGEIKEGQNINGYVVYDKRGARIGVAADHPFDIATQIVPAQPGYFLITGNFGDGKGQINLQPIIAWSVPLGSELRMIPRVLAANEHPDLGYVLYPDGRVTDMFGAEIFESLDEFQEWWRDNKEAEGKAA